MDLKSAIGICTSSAAVPLSIPILPIQYGQRECSLCGYTEKDKRPMEFWLCDKCKKRVRKICGIKVKK